MQRYYIYKGSQKLDSFYLSSFPAKFIHYLNKTNKEKTLNVDSLGFFQRVKFSDMFPIRKYSCISFETEQKAKDYIEYAIISVNTDDRFSDELKIQLLHYLQIIKIAF